MRFTPMWPEGAKNQATQLETISRSGSMTARHRELSRRLGRVPDWAGRFLGPR